MSERRLRAAGIGAAFAIVAAAGACRGRASGVPAEAAPAATAVTPAAAAPHGDHNPHHGGIVMMKGELHYEVVFDPTGRSHQVYFTNAVREDLPASLATSVSIAIRRERSPEEAIALKIDDTGESWIGSGRPLDDPARTTARVTFTIAGEPYWIDMPLAAR